MATKPSYVELEQRVQKLEKEAVMHELGEKALGESEHKLNAHLQNTPIGAISWDLNFRVIEWNPAAEAIFGYSRVEALGKHASELILPEEVKEMVDDIFRDLISEKGGVRSTNENITKEGRLIICDWYNTPLKEADGNVISVASLVNDITNRTRAEEALRDAAALNQKIFLESPIGISISDETGQCVETNDSMGKIIGATKEQVLKQNYNELESWKKSGMLSKARDAIKTGITKRHEIQLTSTFGKNLYIDCYFVPFSKGGKSNLMFMITDISQRKQAEKEKIKAQQMVGEQKKHALLGQVAGKIAHDFNNILGVIMGNAELSLIDCKDGETKKTLELIFEQSIRGKNLTKNLVAFAKDQEPKQEFFRLNEKIDLVINLLKRDLQGIELVKEDKTGVPDLLADPGMIEHAMVNLLQNSIHATSMAEHPRIILRSYCLDENICFEIEDNGCGIPREHLENIYKPSFTLKGSNDVTGSYKSGIKGSGYGMANVKKYIEQHGGSIFVESNIESNVGSYTKFIIRLPVIKKELTSDEKSEIRKEISHFEKYILLVEDEQAISDIQYRILTSEPCNHKVDIAYNGQAAIDLLNRNEYDLISLDYILPGEINGMAVYNHLRETNKTIPILFISGNIEFLESIKELKQKDANIDHLSKPCQNKEYINSLNRLMERATSLQQ